MQAIVETLFDTVYLISVITIGILMIRKSKGNRQLCAQLRVCSQAGGIPVYPRFSQPDNSESWDDAGVTHPTRQTAGNLKR